MGRETELERLAQLLSGARLLTLKGPGGVGKSRLAEALATRVASERAPVVVVPAPPAPADGRLTCDVVAALLGPAGVDDTTEADPVATAAGLVGSAAALLVVDDCDHVLDEAGALAEALLASCPGLAVVVTSREPLRLPGERVWDVPGMSLPPAGARTCDALRASDAGRLFLERAAEVRKGFEPDSEACEAVGSICARLGGVPLAIELAAARIRSMSPVDMRHRLDDALDEVTGARRGGHARHRTLQATVEWTDRLLVEDERLLLQRLSIFRGEAPLDAIESVCADDRLPRERILEALLGLAERSLVSLVEGVGGGRYELAEIVRLYARERLQRTPQAVEDLTAAHRRHEERVARRAHEEVAGEAGARLLVRALGRLEIRVPDRAADALDWQYAKPREILVYLLLHPDGRTREQIAVDFWPEATSRRARNNVHVALHRLRRALGDPSWVVHEGGRYKVSSALDIDFDVTRFESEVRSELAGPAERAVGSDALERLRRALGLYRGDLLDGAEVGDWHLRRRDSLRVLFVRGMLFSASLLLDGGVHDEARAAYDRVLEADDLSEEAYRGLMVCHARAGDRVGALRVYDALGRHFRAELETDPSEAATALAERVRRGEAV